MTTRADAGTSRGTDATTILTAYVVLLWAVPSPMVVPALGSAGALSNILGMVTFFWWLWFHVRRSEPTYAGVQPVRAATLCLLLVMVAVYVHAMARPMPGDEISSADSGMLRLLGFAGIVLLSNDGLVSIRRHRVLVRRLVLAAGAVAVLGLVQYATKRLYVDDFSIPGLAAGTSDWSLASRSGFVRPSGTSTSPIEYGVVLGMMLPPAIVLATWPGPRRWLYRFLLLAMIVAVFLSVSRSAYLSSLVGVLVLGWTWSTRARLQAAAVFLVVTTAIYVLVPSLLGTIVGLFSNADEDPSVASRTGSYTIVAEFFLDSPLVGRGFGTFLPKYRILDNGYLGLLIEGGLLGLSSLLVLVATGVYAARSARRMTQDTETRGVAQALVASIAAGAIGMAFFDTFAFPQTAGCFFLMVGLAGSLRRLTMLERMDGHQTFFRAATGSR